MKKYIKIIILILVIFCSSVIGVSAEEVDPLNISENGSNSSVETLNLDDDDFTNGSLVIGHSMYKNFDTGYSLLPYTEFNNGLNIMGKYDNSISFGSFTSNTVVSDRVTLKFNDNSKLLSKGSNIKVDLTNIRNYIEHTDGTRFYWSTDGLRYLRVYYRDINGTYQHENIWDTSVIKHQTSSATYSISFELEDLPFDVYELYFESVYDIFSYKGCDSFVGTSARFNRFGGFIDSKLLIEEIPYDETKGLLGGIIEWIKSIYQGIIDLPNNIANLFSEMFNWILSALQSLGNFLADCINTLWINLNNAITTLGEFIINNLKGLFIPRDNYFKNLFDDLYEFFSNKLGFLLFPFELMYTVLNKLLEIGSGTGILHIPQVDILGHVLIESNEFNLMYWMTNTLGDYYDVYYSFVDCVLLFMFSNFARRKYDSLIAGGKI